MLLVRGKYEKDDESSRLLVSEITSIEAVREKQVREVEIRLSGGLGSPAIRSLAGIMERYPGDRKVSVVVELNGSRNMRVRAVTARRIRPSEEFIRAVEAVCGTGSVVMK
jgi:hypothetical protein